MNSKEINEVAASFAHVSQDESEARGVGLAVYSRKHTGATRNLEADLAANLDAAGGATSASCRDIALDKDVAVGATELGAATGLNTAVVDAGGAGELGPDSGSRAGSGAAVHRVCCSE